VLKYFAISRSSLKDGPGKRVVLFVQGCPLHCSWCHSPHSQEHNAQLLFFAENCRRCGKCAAGCSNRVHMIDECKHFIDRSKCKLCGRCVLNCNHRALNLQFYQEEPSTIFHKIQPELKLLQQIGGLTISGGEPMFQAEEIEKLLFLCKDYNINTAIETSGAVSRDHFTRLVDYVDYWLYGLRLTDRDLLKAFTGADFDMVYENLVFLANRDPNKIIIRVPIIPNHNDNMSNFHKIAKIMVSLNLKKIELLPFNRYTSHYYKALGKQFELERFSSVEGLRMDEIIRIFTDSKVEIRVIE
jgi:glycyl-radical enzyme activating protein